MANERQWEASVSKMTVLATAPRPRLLQRLASATMVWPWRTHSIVLNVLTFPPEISAMTSMA